MVRIAFVGDVMLGRLVAAQLRQGRRPESCWGDLTSPLHSADAVIANLECAITSHDEPWRRTPKVFHFGADPVAAEVLKAGNIRAVSLANNHILDFDVQGLADTLQHLDRAGIAHAGAGLSEADAFAPARFKAGGLNVALFAVTDNEPPFSAHGANPGTAFVDPSNTESAPRPGAAEIERARKAGAELVVLSCHFGPNMVLEPSAAIRSYRRAAISRGVDIVHGHSAHVVQSIERLGNALILHDTGDFLDDYAVDPAMRNDLSFVFLIETERAQLRRLLLVPVALDCGQVHRARHDDAAYLCTRTMALSAKFGTALSRTDEGLELVLRG